MSNDVRLQNHYWVGQRDLAVRRDRLTLQERRTIVRSMLKRGKTGHAAALKAETDWLELSVRYFDEKGRPETRLADLAQARSAALERGDAAAESEELEAYLDERDARLGIGRATTAAGGNT